MDKRNIFTKVLIVFLVLMFLGGIALGAVDVLSAEGQQPPETVRPASLSQLPKTEDEIIAYLNSCTYYAISEKAKLDISTKNSIDDDSISFGENDDLLKKSFIFAKESILSDITKQFSSVNIGFGGDFSGELWNLNFDTAAISRTESKEDGDNYIFKIIFPNEDNPFGMDGIVNKSFHMSDAEQVLNYLWESYKGFADVKNISVKCTDLGIDATVNRLTDKIKNITYLKKLNVEADITFLGELSAAGTKKMSFNLEQKTVFEFTWANLALTPKKLAMKKGDIKVVGAIVTALGESKVKWSSSNPAVASVDSDGYVKAREVSTEPVMITAEFDYLGAKYTDTCDVYVTVPVTKVKISDTKLTMTLGETKTLEASVKPEDATIKDVLWYTNNPLVATVDANGKVTAIAEGETEIYILSKDGYYKISCMVTVTE